MVTSEYWPLDVFRIGLLPNMWSLVQIGLGVDRYVFFRADADTDYYDYN